jgi:hypothetical protein
MKKSSPIIVTIEPVDEHIYFSCLKRTDITFEPFRRFNFVSSIKRRSLLVCKSVLVETRATVLFDVRVLLTCVLERELLCCPKSHDR